jgi:hypothetical protein
MNNVNENENPIVCNLQTRPPEPARIQY